VGDQVVRALDLPLPPVMRRRQHRRRTVHHSHLILRFSIHRALHVSLDIYLVISVYIVTYIYLFAAASSTSRRGRGPTRGLVLERLTREGRVAVEFPQDCLRPVGDSARLFTSEVGVLCRSLIPATTPRWTDVTDDVRQLIRQRLQVKFSKLKFSFVKVHLRLSPIVNRFIALIYYLRNCRINLNSI
jgi:hypothetical protein